MQINVLKTVLTEFSPQVHTSLLKQTLFFGFSQDSQTVPLSPIKAAAQERIVRQNTELAEFVSKLNEEKKELRVALGNLEEQIAQYRQRERANEEVSCTGKRVTHLQWFFFIDCPLARPRCHARGAPKT